MQVSKGDTIGSNSSTLLSVRPSVRQSGGVSFQRVESRGRSNLVQIEPVRVSYRGTAWDGHVVAKTAVVS